LDFNETPRNGVADVGAYRYNSAGNPGWTLAEDFKGSTLLVAPLPPSNFRVN
jgi:hypothetical protein